MYLYLGVVCIVCMTHSIYLFTLEYYRSLLACLFVCLFVSNFGASFWHHWKAKFKESGNFQKNHKSEWMCGYAIRPLQLRSWKTALATSNRRDSFPELRDAQRLSACWTNTWSTVLVPNTVLRPQHLVAWWREHPSHINSKKEVIHLKIIIKLFKKISELLGLRKSSKTTSRSYDQIDILRGPPIIVNPSFPFVIGRSDNLTNLV